MHNSEDFKNKAWAKMSVILDEEMPQKRRLLMWWPWGGLALIMLLLLGFLTYSFFNKKNNNIQLEQQTINYTNQSSKDNTTNDMATAKRSINNSLKTTLEQDNNIAEVSEPSKKSKIGLKKFQQVDQPSYGMKNKRNSPQNEIISSQSVLKSTSQSTQLLADNNISIVSEDLEDKQKIINHLDDNLEKTKLNLIANKEKDHSYIESPQLEQLTLELESDRFMFNMNNMDKYSPWKVSGAMNLGLNYLFSTKAIGAQLESRIIFNKTESPFQIALGLGLAKFSTISLNSDDDYDSIPSNNPEISDEDRGNTTMDQSFTTLSIPLRFLHAKRRMEFGIGIDYIYNLDHQDIAISSGFLVNEKVWNEHNWTIVLESAIRLTSRAKVYSNYAYDLNRNTDKSSRMTNVSLGLQFTF